MSEKKELKEILRPELFLLILAICLVFLSLYCNDYPEETPITKYIYHYNITIDAEQVLNETVKIHPDILDRCTIWSGEDHFKCI